MHDDYRLRGYSDQERELIIHALSALHESRFLVQRSGEAVVRLVESFDSTDKEERAAAVERVAATRHELLAIEQLAIDCWKHLQGRAMETHNANEQPVE